jgi:ribosomal protein S18 acetylase RimI-like enzyme
MLASEDADFDLDGRSGGLEPLSDEQARRFLANPAVLLWVAEAAGTVVGFNYCVEVPLRSGEGRELLLYEIGVRNAWRRQGVGRALLAEMERWMKAEALSTAWVCGDNPTAVAFYQGCGYHLEADQPTYLTREV